MSSILPSESPSLMSMRTTLLATSRQAITFAQVAPTAPAPTTVTFDIVVLVWVGYFRFLGAGGVRRDRIYKCLLICRWNIPYSLLNSNIVSSVLFLSFTSSAFFASLSFRHTLFSSISSSLFHIFFRSPGLIQWLAAVQGIMALLHFDRGGRIRPENKVWRTAFPIPVPGYFSSLFLSSLSTGFRSLIPLSSLSFLSLSSLFSSLLLSSLPSPPSPFSLLSTLSLRSFTLSHLSPRTRILVRGFLLKRVHIPETNLSTPSRA